MESGLVSLALIPAVSEKSRISLLCHCTLATALELKPESASGLVAKLHASLGSSKYCPRRGRACCRTRSYCKSRTAARRAGVRPRRQAPGLTGRLDPSRRGTAACSRARAAPTEPGTRHGRREDPAGLLLGPLGRRQRASAGIRQGRASMVRGHLGGPRLLRQQARPETGELSGLPVAEARGGSGTEQVKPRPNPPVPAGQADLDCVALRPTASEAVTPVEGSGPLGALRSSIRTRASAPRTALRRKAARRSAASRSR